MEEHKDSRPSSSGARLIDEPDLGFDLMAPDAARARGGLWDAVRSNAAVVLIAIIIITGAAVAAGLKRTPNYSATTTLSVLHLDFGAPGALSGFSTAAAALADTYARAVHADGVVMPVAARVHASPETISGELTAAAVPSSPVFHVTATARTAGQAITLANLVGAQLQKYIQSVNASNPDVPRLYRQLSHAEIALITQQQTLMNRQASLARVHGTPSPSDQAALAKAQASVSVAQDRVNSLKSAYSQSIVGQSATQFLQPLEAATSAVSDRKRKIELLGFVGFVAGIGVGVGLALLLQERRRRRLGSF